MYNSGILIQQFSIVYKQQWSSCDIKRNCHDVISPQVPYIDQLSHLHRASKFLKQLTVQNKIAAYIKKVHLGLTRGQVAQEVLQLDL